METKTAAIEMRNITKRFGPVLANDKVWLNIYRGEILALLGENGSGKTTLMNMLSGIYFPDEGEIKIDGKEVVIRSPKDAFDNGIGMIHQHFKLVDVLTAAENIVLGLPGKLDLKAASAKIREICDKYGFSVDPAQKIYDMSVSQKQTVEIVKVLYRGADILILDEPTAVLTPQETDKLFAVLRNMRNDGKAIVIITHKMHEVEALSDRVAILRHGQFIGDMLTAHTNAQEMTNMMVGHAVSLNIERPDPVDPKPRIEVKGLTVRSVDGIVKLDDVSFTANSGEILGIAGISGCGQKELLEAIAGLQTVESGSISYIEDDGSRDELIGKDPLSIAELGVSLSFVPEDRLGMGLVGNMNLADNMMLRSFRRGKSIFTDRRSPRKVWVLLQNIAMLLCIALAVTPAFKMRFWNIGGEGQVLAGALAAAACMICLRDTLPNALVIVCMCVSSILAGALWGFIPAYFKAKYNTNETLFTLMMNYVATQLVAYFVIVWENPKGSGQIGIINQSTEIGWFPQIGSYKYLLNILIVAVVTILMYFYLNYTKHGYEITVVGESERTARYVGIKVDKVIIRTMILSGAVCGLCGLLLVGSTNHTLTTSIAGGRGFTAVMVSWLAKFNPIWMIFTSFLLVFLSRGAGEISTAFGLNQSFSDILTGIILFFIIGSEFFITYKINFRKSAGKEDASHV